LNSKLEAKKRFLEPKFFNYYFDLCVKCFNFSNVNDLNKKLLELRLLKKFVEKINKKFDIFNYLKRVREVKNLEEYVFKDHKNLAIFKILSRNIYEVTIDSKEISDKSQKEIHKNKIIKEWTESQNLSPNDTYTNFVIRKLINDQ